MFKTCFFFSPRSRTIICVYYVYSNITANEPTSFVVVVVVVHLRAQSGSKTFPPLLVTPSGVSFFHFHFLETLCTAREEETTTRETTLPSPPSSSTPAALLLSSTSFFAPCFPTPSSIAFLPFLLLPPFHAVFAQGFLKKSPPLLLLLLPSVLSINTLELLPALLSLPPLGEAEGLFGWPPSPQFAPFDPRLIRQD